MSPGRRRSGLMAERTAGIVLFPSPGTGADSSAPGCSAFNYMRESRASWGSSKDQSSGLAVATKVRRDTPMCGQRALRRKDLTVSTDLLEQLRAAYERNDVVRVRRLLDEQATALITSGAAASKPEAQLQMAGLFGLTSWAEVEAQLALLKQRELSHRYHLGEITARVQHRVQGRPGC